MLSKPLRSVRVAATTGFALAVVVATVAAAAVREADPPKVEYFVVEGRECLQPKVSDASADLADYRSAESRWLASKYPGVIAPTRQTMILLSPADRSDGRPKVTTVQSDTFYFDGIVGSAAAICFDINLTTSSEGTHD